MRQPNFDDFLTQGQQEALQIYELIHNTSSPQRYLMQNQQNYQKYVNITKALNSLDTGTIRQLNQKNKKTKFILRKFLLPNFIQLFGYCPQLAREIQQILRLKKNCDSYSVFKSLLYHLAISFLYIFIILMYSTQIGFSDNNSNYSAISDIMNQNPYGNICKPDYQFLYHTIYFNQPIDMVQQMIETYVPPFSQQIAQSQNIVILVYRRLIIQLYKFVYLSNLNIVSKLVYILMCLFVIRQRLYLIWKQIKKSKTYQEQLNQMNRNTESLKKKHVLKIISLKFIKWIKDKIGINSKGPIKMQLKR